MANTPSDAPHFLIIAGPNGSGKSSAYERSIVELGGRSFRIINPDQFASRIAKLERLDPTAANLAAVERIEEWLETSILAGHTVGVETVLSTAKYRRLVELAKRIGHRFQFIYVVLDNPDLNIQRIALRVSKGGHDVPPEKVRSRYKRSLAQMPWFLEQADIAMLYDNSSAQPRLVARRENGATSIDRDAPAALMAALGVQD